VRSGSPGCGGVLRPGRWRRGPARALEPWSSLGGAGSVRPGCGGADLGRDGGLFFLKLSEGEMGQNNRYDPVFQRHLSFLF
jgi:hypothetical protein